MTHLLEILKINDNEKIYGTDRPEAEGFVTRRERRGNALIKTVP